MAWVENSGNRQSGASKMVNKPDGHWKHSQGDGPSDAWAAPVSVRYGRTHSSPLPRQGPHGTCRPEFTKMTLCRASTGCRKVSELPVHLREPEASFPLATRSHGCPRSGWHHRSLRTFGGARLFAANCAHGWQNIYRRCPIFLYPSFGPWSALARTLPRADKYLKVFA